MDGDGDAVVDVVGDDVDVDVDGDDGGDDDGSETRRWIELVGDSAVAAGTARRDSSAAR